MDEETVMAMFNAFQYFTKISLRGVCEWDLCLVSIRYKKYCIENLYKSFIKGRTHQRIEFYSASLGGTKVHYIRIHRLPILSCGQHWHRSKLFESVCGQSRNYMCDFFNRCLK